MARNGILQLRIVGTSEVYGVRETPDAIRSQLRDRAGAVMIVEGSVPAPDNQQAAPILRVTRIEADARRSASTELRAAPWLVTLSQQKAWVFAASGTLIVLNLLYVHRLAPRLRVAAGACSVEDSGACTVSDRVSRIILWTSAVLYGAGFLVAFLLGPVLTRP